MDKKGAQRGRLGPCHYEKALQDSLPEGQAQALFSLGFFFPIVGWVFGAGLIFTGMILGQKGPDNGIPIVCI